MESILFSQLTETDYGQDNDELLLQQNGITKRVKSKNFFDGAIANAMHEKYTAGKLLVADEDGNIAESAKTEADLDKAGSAVTYVEQELTDEQKTQARDNIGLNDENSFNGNKTFEGDVQIKGTLKSNNYSSNEKCIGTWINGKPLYRKIVAIANIGAALTNDIAHGISNLDQITNSFIVLYSGNGNFYPLPWTRGGYAGYQINRQYINFWFSSSWDGYKGMATLEYTKTTD